MAQKDLDRRLATIEARLDIGQLPIRYALAIDGRDLDTWIRLFVPNVDCGRYGVGREALRSFIEPQVRRFYRSMHQIVGHQFELTAPDSAGGKTYCKAEHEVGERWIVMAICYSDRYRQIDGEWFFESRKEEHWYAVDHLERPQAVNFHDWERASKPAYPWAFPTWDTFWGPGPKPGRTSTE